MSTTLLTATNLGVKRGDRWLIKDVNIALKEGEITTVIGPNGAGKSTLVRSLLKLIKTGNQLRRKAWRPVAY